jgi:hypothetical protein
MSFLSAISKTHLSFGMRENAERKREGEEEKKSESARV